MKTSAPFPSDAPPAPVTIRRARRILFPATAVISTLVLPLWSGWAETQVTMDHNAEEEAKAPFHFKTVRSQLNNVFPTSLSVSLLDGTQDENGGGPEVLFDAQGADSEDQPDHNFFFQPGDNGGRILVMLGQTTPISEVDTYSWHTGARAPQVYKLYASDGGAPGFVAEPKRPQNPGACGWKLLADVDTRKKYGGDGGQYGVSVQDSTGSLGDYRYLLFDVSRTQGNELFDNTFFSEINVIANDAKPAIAAVGEPMYGPIPASAYGGAPAAPSVVPAPAPVATQPALAPIAPRLVSPPAPAAPSALAPGDSMTLFGPALDGLPVSSKVEKTVWLGVYCDEASDELRNTLPLTPGTGLIVRGVSPDSPASAAGLQEYDVLTKLDDQLLVNPAQLQSLVKGKRDGDTVHVSYLRHGQAGEATAKLGTHDVVANGKTNLNLYNMQVAPAPAFAAPLRDRTVVLDRRGKVVETFIDGTGRSDQSPAARAETMNKLEKTLQEQGLDPESIKRILKQVNDQMLNKSVPGNTPKGAMLSNKAPDEDGPSLAPLTPAPEPISLRPAPRLR